MPPRDTRECDRHEARISSLEKRMRLVEITQARTGVKLALIAAVAAALGSAVMTVIAGLALFALKT